MRWVKGLVAPLLSLTFAISGQWLITRQIPNYQAGAVSYALSLVLLLWILLGWPPAALSPAPDSPIFRHIRPITANSESRLVFILGILILAAMAFVGFAGNSLMGGIWAWLGAILLFLVSFAEIPDVDQENPIHSLTSWWQQVDKRVLTFLLGIILLAIFFRFYRLGTVPAEMTSDHAEKLMDVQDLLDGQRPIFFPRNTGREAVQFYLTAFLVRFTSLQTNHLALKVGTAIVGVFAIPFTYLLGKEFYGRVAGLLAAFFLAISHWHVAITRVGLRFPFTAALATPALYFLFRAFKTNRRNDWLTASLFLGIGLHSYTAMRIVPLLFVVLIGLELTLDGLLILRKRPLPKINSWNRRFLQNALLAGFFTGLLFLPLLRVIIDDPTAFWLRTLSRAQTTETQAAGELLWVFINNIKNALLMFNVKGDVVLANTLAGSPVLGMVSAALFVLGLFYLIWRLIPHHDRRSLYALVTLFFLLLPSILSLAYPQENPSVVRTGGAIPWVMLVAALPLVVILTRMHDLPANGGKLVSGIVIIILVIVAIFYNYNWYFSRYDASIRRSLWNSTEMGMVVHDFVEEGGDWADAYHIPYSHWVDTRNIGINAGNIRWANTLSEEKWFGDHSRTAGPKLYLLFPEDVESLRRLMWLFPRGKIEIYDSPWEGKDFIIYRVP
jgi:hypothetical protein